MDNNVLTQTEAAVSKQKGEPYGLSKKLNQYFHHLDRGGTLKGEVMAGIAMFSLAICVIFMNMQIVAGAVNGKVELGTSPGDPTNIAAASTYAQIYIGSILIAFIGSLIIGLVAGLPFAQLSTMGFASSMLSLIGTEAGLTYYNLLFINFIAALIYGLVVGVPVVREGVYKALPASVRRVLPAAAGLIFAFAALKMSGFVTTSDIALGNIGGQSITVITGFADFSGGKKMATFAFIGAIAAILIYCILKGFKRKHPVFWSLAGGTGLFILIDIIFCGLDVANTDSFINFGRVWMITASQASMETPFGDSYLTYFGPAIKEVFSNFSDIFTKGADFSAYTGSTLALVLSGVLCYVFMGVYDAEGTMLAVKDALNRNANEAGRVDFDSQKGIRKILLCNAGMNIIAPFLGIGGISVSKTSVAATEDNGKSGLASIVAGIGFLISLFLMLFPVLFATVTYPVYSMNQWNYDAYGNGGFVYLMQGAAFGIADAVMVCVGLSMLRALKNINWRELADWIPAVVTVAASAVLTNLAFGIALGVIVFCLIRLLSFRKGSKLAIPTVVLLALMIVMLVQQYVFI
jgi:xanthine/uracil/vitamin C permease (AzgA family)